MVSQEKLSGDWHTVIGKVREKFGQITNDDLSKIHGNLDQLVGLIQQKAGQTREQAESFLATINDTAGSAFRDVTERGQQAYGQASDMLDEGVKQVSKKAGEGYEYARETVARRPAESIAIIAGLGVLAGIAIGVSMNSKR
jgi:uncharacterized protein YjbJ (UPF0337 family)